MSLWSLFKETDSLINQVALGISMMWSALVIGSGMVHNIGMEASIDLFATSAEKAGELYRIIQTVHMGLGVVVGIAGILTIIPPLFNSVIMVFALGQMVWWVGIGLNMVRDRKVV